MKNYILHGRRRRGIGLYVVKRVVIKLCDRGCAGSEGFGESNWFGMV